MVVAPILVAMAMLPMVMALAAAGTVWAMLPMVVAPILVAMAMLFHQFFFQRFLLLYHLINLLPIHFIPRGGDNCGAWVFLPDFLHHKFRLFRLHILGAA